MTRTPTGSRRAVIAALVAGLACCAWIRAAAAETREVVRDGAQVRSERAFQGRVLAEPARGTRLVVQKRESEWLAVEAPGGAHGWIHEVFLGPPVAESPVAEAPDAEAPKAVAPRVEPTDAPAASDPCREDKERAWRLEAQLSSLSHVNAQAASLQGALDSCERERERARLATAAQPPAAPPETAELEQARAQVRRLESELADARRAAAEARRKLADMDASFADREILARADERDRAEERHAAETDASEDRHEETMQRFIEYVTARHDAALERDRANLAQDCEVRLRQERQAHLVELRKVGKQSGWEAEFAAAVKEGVEKQIKDRLEQQEVRLEAKCRGGQVDLDRSLREQQVRLEADCDRRCMASADEALTRLRTDMEARARAEREREELRCQMALELVLENAAAGGDVESMRKKLDQRRESQEAPSPPAEQQP